MIPDSYPIPNREYHHDQNRTTDPPGRALAPGAAPSLAPTTLSEAIYEAGCRAGSQTYKGTYTRLAAGATFLDYCIAWRFWEINYKRLFAINSSHGIWSVGQPYRACCKMPKSRHSYHAPVLSCSCGIYGTAAENLSDIPTLLLCFPGSSGCPYVLGTVALWGKIIVHERGYRAQYAYPLKLFASWKDGVFSEIDPDLAVTFRTKYSVDIGTQAEAVELLRIT